MPPKPITVAILAMGGEGGGVLADWLVSLAEHSGYYAQTTSVPGVAQRTGSTIYYLEMFPEAAARAAGQEPVLALMPVPGELDIVLASELMEAGRAIQRGLVTPDRTTLIASTHRVYSMTERTAIGDARVDDATLIEAGRAAAKNFMHADFAAIAREADSVISAALFGALAATHALPFERWQFEDAIRRGGVGVDGSLRAFAAGCVAQASLPVGTFAARDIVQAGVQRLTDYQDARYAAEYLDLLEPIRALGDPALLDETARYLALWMSYEDAIRVADLKTRAARFDRVHRESRAGAGQLVRINDYVYPRVGELADILPAPLGEWLLRTGWARRMVERFTRHGKVVETTSLRGFLRLYAVAALRPWRRKSLRYLREHRRIREWLTLIPELAAENHALALEVAVCPRLIKGYGDTHVNGMRKFDALMAALPTLRRMDDAAPRLKKLREAALADDTGQKLAEALKLVSSSS
ncbi:putative indolepyruvate ferredoxin beta subunit oxidoreductase protein [Candidatus Sulfopaludibacter sp. SbA6]|nr:putative indolepyruvate ferredoxin beta subunit oxidoreductase protein [Candidatus Sulfopaludibacter sp. SbA6]